MKNTKKKKPVGLYIHVPFCATKCNYCCFYSLEYNRKKNKTTAESWKSAVIRNVQYYSKHEQLSFDTVFFGGGTPSLLYREVAQIVPILPTTPNAEITVEANPDDITPQMLEELLQAGVNRLSIGVQSLDDSILRVLGRRHDSSTAIKAVELARQAGFDNISVDIMLGIPEQTDIGAIYELPVNHISAYIYEPPAGRGSRGAPSEEAVASIYLQTAELLEKHEFPQYEISNFGEPCRHNLKYWNCEEYIGIGPAAHSYYGGKRFAVPEDLELFINPCSESLQKTYVTEETPATFAERVMLKLRLTSGVSLDELSNHERDFLLESAQTIPKEYIRLSEKNISLTAKGFLVANRIIGEFLANITE
jgi:oxygen-independent coproporphyrinogen-3 oxidase